MAAISITACLALCSCCTLSEPRAHSVAQAVTALASSDSETKRRAVVEFLAGCELGAARRACDESSHVGRDVLAAVGGGQQHEPVRAVVGVVDAVAQRAAIKGEGHACLLKLVRLHLHGGQLLSGTHLLQRRVA